MTVELQTPDVAGLADAITALASWQQEGAPFQLHPGDLGWQHRFGAETTAGLVRTWSRDGRLVALGFLDEATLVRLAIAPDLLADEDLALAVASDLDDPGRGVLGAGEVSLEVPGVARVRALLAGSGWIDDEPWTPLRLDLTDPVEDPGLRVEVVGRELAAVRAAVHRAAFPKSTFTAEGWEVLASGPAYADARCLVGFDGDDPVAGITVWSAGAGRPGVIEPMGVDPAHRGRGWGRGITLAGAAALRELGSSSATVATPSANVGGVAAYLSAGFTALPQRLDLRRPA